MQQVMALDASLQGDVVQVKDDYAVGPLLQVYEPEGYQARKAWWMEVLEHSPYTEQTDLVDDRLTVHQLKKALDADAAERLWIWAGQNQHDVCGYYWLMSQLKDYQGRVEILYLNNLPFINEKGGIFYPQWLHEIRPAEFLKAKKLARPITPSEFEVDPDEWKRICQAPGLVRILEGGKKLAVKEETFYDKDLLAQLTPEPVKLGKFLAGVLAKMKPRTGDAFLVWRMRRLAAEGAIQLSGDWSKGWKDVAVAR
jgi:hypothetical protein